MADLSALVGVEFMRAGSKMAITGHRRRHLGHVGGRAPNGLALRPGRLGGNGKLRRVLIVDDDPEIRMLCSISLRIEGLVVLEAADGSCGLAQARCERPDLVVTDVMMPGLDGFQLAEALRCDERTRQIPLIFLSGEAEPANEERAHELEALAYLTKPFEPDALASLVADALACASEPDGPTAPAVPRRRVIPQLGRTAIDEQ